MMADAIASPPAFDAAVREHLRRERVIVVVVGGCARRD